MPLIKIHLSEKIIDKWFFIRYSDPDFHLRIRFRLTNPLHLIKIITEINQIIKPLLETFQVSKFQTDTYVRDLARYGSSTISHSETLFFIDSGTTTQMLDLITGKEGEEIRWYFAIKSVDALLLDFNFTEKQQLELINHLQTSFGNEFGMNKNLKIQIDQKFRNNRTLLNNLLKRDSNSLSKYNSLFELIRLRSKKNFFIIKEIYTLKENSSLDVDIYNLVASYIHMTLNRIFRSKPRFNEMLIYSFLYRYYKSNLARKQKGNI